MKNNRLFFKKIFSFTQNVDYKYILFCDRDPDHIPAGGREHGFEGIFFKRCAVEFHGPDFLFRRGVDRLEVGMADRLMFDDGNGIEILEFEFEFHRFGEIPVDREEHDFIAIGIVDAGAVQIRNPAACDRGRIRIKAILRIVAGGVDHDAQRGAASVTGGQSEGVERGLPPRFAVFFPS